MPLAVLSSERYVTLLLNNAVAFTCAALQGCSKVSKPFEVLIAGRVVAGICCASPTIPAIYSHVTLTFCPESPKHLLVNKRDDDAAEAALIWLRKTSDVSEEMEAMKKE